MGTMAVRARRVHVAVPGPSYDDAVVLIVDGIVRAAGPVGEVAVGGDVHVLDLGDAVLIPGMVDAHVHLALQATDDPAASVLEERDEVLTARMAANGRALLAAGVTTARDLGAPVAPAVAARAVAAAEGGLRLLVAGPPITAVGAHLHFFGGAVATADEAAQLIGRLAGAGVDWIKLVLSGGEITRGSHPRAPGLPAPAARAAVEAAHGHGLPVAVHAHTAMAVRLAVDLGVDTVEHCTLLDAAPGGLVAPRFVCPTANVRWAADGQQARRIRADRLAALRDGGSTLIAGTDAGIPGVGFAAYSDGLVALHGAGLPPAQVLQAATSAAAAALGLADRGTLEAGQLGDLVALDGDPVDDVRFLRHPRAVVVGGRRVATA